MLLTQQANCRLSNIHNHMNQFLQADLTHLFLLVLFLWGIWLVHVRLITQRGVFSLDILDPGNSSMVPQVFQAERKVLPLLLLWMWCTSPRKRTLCPKCFGIPYGEGVKFLGGPYVGLLNLCWSILEMFFQMVTVVEPRAMCTWFMILLRGSGKAPRRSPTASEKSVKDQAHTREQGVVGWRHRAGF